LTKHSVPRRNKLNMKVPTASGGEPRPPAPVGQDLELPAAHLNDQQTIPSEIPISVDNFAR
jgi:hypothetical protein